MRKKPIMFCNVKGCFETAVAKGKCPLHLLGSNMHSYSEKPRLPKRPSPPHGLLGVELEFECNREITSVCTRIGFVCMDASVSGGELKKVGHCERIGGHTASVAKRLHIAGAKITNKCGFHVHIDIAGYRAGAREVYRWLAHQQNWFFECMPESRQDNGYCGRLPDHDQTYHRPYWLAWRGYIDTIELRIHPGTLNPAKIHGWIDVCNQIGHLIRGQESNVPSIDSPPLSVFSGLAREYLDARHRGGGILNLSSPII